MSEAVMLTQRRRTIVLALASTLLLAACDGGSAGGASDEATGQTPPGPTGAPVGVAGPTAQPDATRVGRLIVTSTDCALRGVEGSIGTGEVVFAASNETDGTALFNIARLEGATFEDFEAHIAEEIRLARAGEPYLGHPSFAVPLFEILLAAGEDGLLSGTIEEPGTYVLSCARVFEQTGEMRPAGALGPLKVE
jgi:hypothetical protein